MSKRLKDEEHRVAAKAKQQEKRLRKGDFYIQVKPEGTKDYCYSIVPRRKGLRLIMGNAKNVTGGKLKRAYIG